jgi:hypothetical protein
LKETGSKDPAVMNQAGSFIKEGYRRLISFETKEHGFEWFGRSPAHLGLTAYGIMEFTDMMEVYDGVDKQMLHRTLEWLLSKRDNKGGFKKSSAYAMGNASEIVTNAYIIYALSEVGTDLVDLEYKTAMKEALTSLDPYRLALMANAAFNFNKVNDANTLLDKIKTLAEKQSWESLKFDHTITRSYGKSQFVEAASLYALALMKAPQTDWPTLYSVIDYILNSRSYGSFGSTQATILALKAIKKYTSLNKLNFGGGKIEIVVNGTKLPVYTYEKATKNKISLENLESYLKDGKNTVDIRYLETDMPLPFSFDITWNSLTLESSNNCKINLKTALSTKTTKVGETVRLTVNVTNKANEGLPMTVAIIGIPSGLSLQPWQLKEIMDKHQIDFYEVIKNYLVIYYTEMKPSESHQLNFDLKAEIPGIYEAPASSGYLYYTNEYKDWEDGENIRINR